MVKIELGKGDFVWIVGLIVLVGVGFVYGYVLDGSGDPSVMGHSRGEIKGVCLSNGTNCGASETYVDGEIASVGADITSVNDSLNSLSHPDNKYYVRSGGCLGTDTMVNTMEVGKTCAANTVTYDCSNENNDKTCTCSGTPCTISSSPGWDDASQKTCPYTRGSSDPWIGCIKVAQVCRSTRSYLCKVA